MPAIEGGICEEGRGASVGEYAPRMVVFMGDRAGAARFGHGDRAILPTLNA